MIAFYERDDISAVMPGKKDTISVRGDDGQKQLVQKRLLRANLKIIFFKFQNEFADIKISFSKFATFRPRNCVLAGSSGTHAVCVCPLHENMRLLLKGMTYVMIYASINSRMKRTIKLSFLVLCF